MMEKERFSAGVQDKLSHLGGEPAAARLRVAASAEKAGSDTRKTGHRRNVGLFLVRAIGVYRSAAEALGSDQCR